ncbi:MAG: hypothetical protein PUF00_02640 [Paraprevotella sp.]|nr:hypothetical protein [Paraprevotella sp.]MDD6823951.1 hypothetical protein [Paraprevotella sp.]
MASIFETHTFAKNPTHKHYMKKIRLTAIIWVFTCACMFADELPSNWERIPVTPEMNDNDIPLEDNTKPHRAPQRIILPEVYYDAGQACLHILTGEVVDEVSYIIRYDEAGTAASGVAIKRDGHYDIDLSFLPCGDYPLIIEIAGCEYSAQISL